MPVFRIERTHDYTVMSNHHLKNPQLTLKAKGLLSMMLSFPDEWNYSERGLAAICKEGVDAIHSAIKELEKAGYMERHQLRGKGGKIVDTEYVIYEKPHKPDMAPPDTEDPDMAEPDAAEPDTGNPGELNTQIPNAPLRALYKVLSSSIISYPPEIKKAHSRAVRRKTLNSTCRYATFGSLRRNTK